MVALSLAALAVVLVGLWIVDGRLLPPAPLVHRLAELAIVTAAGAGPWLVVRGVLGARFAGPAELYLPVALLGAIAAYLATIAPRSLGMGRRALAVFSAVWSGLVFSPVALVAFSPVVLDHGGSLAANVAPGSAAAAILLVGGGRLGSAEGAPLRPGIPGVLAVVGGWIAWLAGAELALDAGTPGILLSGTLGALGGIAAWLIVQRVAHQRTTLGAVASGAIGGVMSVTSGAALFHPIVAVVTGFVAGGAAALFSTARSSSTGRSQWAIPATHLVAAGIGVVVIGIAGIPVGYIVTGQPDLAVTQLLAVVVVSAWSAAWSVALWLLLRPRSGDRATEGWRRTTG